MTQPLVSIRNVDAGYDGKIVVHSVSLDVYSDDFIALIGPNGGGKTTIARLLLGQLKPYCGEVEFKQNIRIGYLPQINDVDLKFPISVLDVVLSGLQSCKIFHSKADKDRAMDLLRFAHLDHLAKCSIGDLSGGQRQRVFLCRAIIGCPQLLILDEPVTYMDKIAETNLYKLLPDLSKEMAIVLVSHDIGTISSVVKTIACVNGSLHYHATNKISEEMLSVYECPVEILSHGVIPHRVLKSHLF